MCTSQCQQRASIQRLRPQCPRELLAATCQGRWPPKVLRARVLYHITYIVKHQKHVIQEGGLFSAEYRNPIKFEEILKHWSRTKIPEETLFLKTMVCFSGCLMSSASLQKLFCGVCSALKCSFEEFVREKVIFPSYSSAIFPSLLNCGIGEDSWEFLGLQGDPTSPFWRLSFHLAYKFPSLCKSF